MFTLWYAHLLYKEYRDFMDRLRERRPLAIQAPLGSKENLTENIADQDTLHISDVRFEKSPTPERNSRSVPSPVAISVGSDSEFSGDEGLFQPLATSSPIHNSNLIPPDANITVRLPELISSPQISNIGAAAIVGEESDPNRTPSFSELVSDDPRLVVNIPKAKDFQLVEGTQNSSKNFLEAEKISSHSSGISLEKENLLENYDGEDDEGMDEDESDVEEEENSVISSNPVSVGTNVNSPTGSSIEIINHELNGEEV